MKILVYIHTEKNKVTKKEQYSVLVANENGKEISRFLGDVEYSPDVNALNRVLEELRPTDILLFTKSEKFYNIISNKKFLEYNSPDWDVLKNYLTSGYFECKLLNRANEFMEKAHANLNEKNSSSRKWSVRKDL